MFLGPEVEDHPDFWTKGVLSTLGIATISFGSSAIALRTPTEPFPPQLQDFSGHPGGADAHQRAHSLGVQQRWPCSGHQVFQHQGPGVLLDVLLLAFPLATRTVSQRFSLGNIYQGAKFKKKNFGKTAVAHLNLECEDPLKTENLP